jgi:hypothetical protein
MLRCQVVVLAIAHPEQASLEKPTSKIDYQFSDK